MFAVAVLPCPLRSHWRRMLALCVHVEIKCWSEMVCVTKCRHIVIVMHILGKRQTANIVNGIENLFNVIQIHAFAGDRVQCLHMSYRNTGDALCAAASTISD